MTEPAAERPEPLPRLTHREHAVTPPPPQPAPGGPPAAVTEMVEEAAKTAKKAQMAGFTLSVQGESQYDRTVSFLAACIASAIGVVGVLFLMWWTQDAYKSLRASEVQIIEVYGTGGGSPDGEVGATETIDVPGGAPDRVASNNMEEASEFEEPAMQQQTSGVLDAITDSSNVVEADVAESIPNGGMVASGRRASKIGTGARAFGFGPGDGALPREQRWSVVYSSGLTLDEYARQLDGLGVELGTTAGVNSIEYGSRFSGGPAKRVGLSQAEGRLYFLPQNRTWRENDAALLSRCGIQVGDRPIFQFYPRGVEETLARLETSFKGRQAAEIRTTRFTVVQQGNQYSLRVLSQETLR